MLLESSYSGQMPLQRLKIRAKGVGTEKTPLEILRKTEPACYDNNFVATSNKDKFGQFGKVKTKEGWVATEKLTNMRSSERLSISHECSNDIAQNPGSLIAKLLLFKGHTASDIKEKLEEARSNARRMYDHFVYLILQAKKLQKGYLIPALKIKKKQYRYKMCQPVVNLRINTDVRIDGGKRCYIDTITIRGVEENNTVILTDKSKEDLLLQIQALTISITI